MESANPEQDKKSNPNKQVEPPKIQLPQEVETIIEKLPEEEQKVVQALFVAMSIKRSSFRSPIPPPEVLKGYNEIIPNGAERILAMAEKQSDHRISMERDTIKEEQRQSGRGQNYGFILGIAGLVIAGIMAYLGHDTFAGILGTTTIVGLVSIFVLGKRSQEKDLSEKKDP